MTLRHQILRDAGLLPVVCALALAAPAAATASHAKPAPHNFRAHPMPHNFARPAAT